MPGTDGLVSCVGGCNSKLFNSRRVHRPLVSRENIHLKHCQPVLENSEKCSSDRYRQEGVDFPPIFGDVPNVKKSRKRRDRKASGTPHVTALRIDHSDDDEETPKQSRPLAVRFMFWFCGILLVIVGAGSLLYAIAILCTSMDRVTKFFQTTDKKGMLTDSWRTREYIESIEKKDRI